MLRAGEFPKASLADDQHKLPFALARPPPATHQRAGPFPAEPMRMWPISIRVNKPENDDPSIVEPIELTAATA